MTSQFSLPSAARFTSVAGASADRLALRATGSLRSSKRNRAGFLDLGFRAVADEHRLAAPFDGQRLAGSSWPTSTSIGERERRGVRAHLVDERPGQRRRADSAGHAGGDVEKIAAGGFAGFVDAHGVLPRSLTIVRGSPRLLRISNPCGKRRHDAISPRS